MALHTNGIAVLAKFSAENKKHYEKSAGFACEHTNAIRTVASLTTEREIYLEYKRQLRAQLPASLKSNLKNSSLYAASQSGMFLAFALGFWYGGKLLARGEYTLFQFFLVFNEIIFGAQSAGTVFSFAGDMAQVRSSLPCSFKSIGIFFVMDYVGSSCGSRTLLTFLGKRPKTQQHVC